MYYGMTAQEYIELQEKAATEMYYDLWWDSGKGLVNLTIAGCLVIIDKRGRRERDWYKEPRTGKPWFPKHKNFKSLVKQIIREDGDL